MARPPETSRLCIATPLSPSRKVNTIPSRQPIATSRLSIATPLTPSKKANITTSIPLIVRQPSDIAAAPRRVFDSTRLPPEVLGEIFLLCTGTTDDALERVNEAIFDNLLTFAPNVSTIITSNPVDSLKDTPWNLSHVCRYWRNVACDIPYLWIRIQADLQRPRPNQQHERLQTQFDRSRDAGLHVYLSFPSMHPHNLPLFTLICSTSHRWQSLALVTRPWLFPLFQSRCSSFPNLVTLYNHPIPIHMQPSFHDAVPLFRNAPRLQNIFIHPSQNRQAFHFPFQNIRCCYVPLSALKGLTDDQWLARIERLWIFADYINRATLHPQRFYSDTLTSLTVTETQLSWGVVILLTSLVLPNIVSLDLRVCSDPLLGDVLIDLINRSRCSLVFLRFEVPSLAPEKMRRLFSLCGGLKELIMTAPIVSKETLECLTVGPVDVPVCLLPALEIMDLRSRRPRKLQCVAEFFKMAHSRTSLERPRDPRVSRLKTLRVNAHIPKLEDVHPDIQMMVRCLAVQEVISLSQHEEKKKTFSYYTDRQGRVLVL
ncbi:hypothetical protein D9758_005849 [Tetrapyrgos nigripes]|uniref:F-box domain-containing protein n=1 Tax=Tetrapyrgos nigripes TaxID=182062 RepID=A0A8H5LHH8_9AGAR|nr:hypothetical protein D9758_005849 [Tetrapyrgos nigripes]